MRPWPRGRDRGPGAAKAVSCPAWDLSVRAGEDLEGGFPGVCCPPAQRVLLLLHGWVDNQVASLVVGRELGSVAPIHISSPCPKPAFQSPLCNNLHRHPSREQLIINVEQSRQLTIVARPLIFCQGERAAPNMGRGPGRGMIPWDTGLPGHVPEACAHSPLHDCSFRQ